MTTFTPHRVAFCLHSVFSPCSHSVMASSPSFTLHPPPPLPFPVSQFPESLLVSWENWGMRLGTFFDLTAVSGDLPQ